MDDYLVHLCITLLGKYNVNLDSASLDEKLIIPVFAIRKLQGFKQMPFLAPIKTLA